MTDNSATLPPMTADNRTRPPWRPLVLLLAPLAAIMLALSLGRYGLTSAELWAALSGDFSTPQNAVAHTILWQVRLPRIAAALLVGGALALSGATYQGLFRNPMVSPDILGASAGAAFGAALAILWSRSFVEVQLMAFGCGLAAVTTTTLISRIIGRGRDPMLLLVLTGMVVSTLFAAFISMIKFVADPYSKLPAITFWLMGGLSSVDGGDIGRLSLPLVLGTLPLLLLRWRLDVLSFGEEEAQALGLNTRRLRLLFILAATLLTAAAVSVCGMIGWVGLIIPHLTRLLVGPDHHRLLPATLLVGSTFLLLVDTLARCLFALEIPLGILTAIVGAPFFLGLLLRGGRGWL